MLKFVHLLLDEIVRNDCRLETPASNSSKQSMRSGRCTPRFLIPCSVPIRHVLKTLWRRQQTVSTKHHSKSLHARFVSIECSRKNLDMDLVQDYKIDRLKFVKRNTPESICIVLLQHSKCGTRAMPMIEQRIIEIEQDSL